jgi:Histidine kinase-, DNA gyrase B-, and HSP90-like ATPase
MTELITSLEMGINASPTKTFFVDMLTRDIELEDAILDLLDNCIDGIQRNIKDREVSDRPYTGFWAKISFSESGFTIEDNCGGIPLKVAQTYAFRMGRPINSDDNDLSINAIGTYGIGMKRAIFKMGHSSQITSQTKEDSFRVTISPEWANSDDWQLPFELVDRSVKDNGTTIQVTDIRDSIREEFTSAKSTLNNSLFSKIAHHYSYIIKKGFSVSVNGKKVEQSSFELLWEGVNRIITSNKEGIAPYLYTSQYEDVQIELVIGLRRKNIATENEIEAENEGRRTSSENAGWTIVCNDRVVVYRDKTRLTGWGEAGVPSYHPQFISIAGIVHFRCHDPKKLPITTTKRGLDLSSDLYLYTKNFMREGLKLFTSYTNKWKNDIPQEKEIMKNTYLVDPSIILRDIPAEVWKNTRVRSSTKSTNIIDEKYYKPSLPLPDKGIKGERGKSIKFSRKPDEVEIVSEYLFDDKERDASEVGNECFEKILKEAQG